MHIPHQSFVLSLVLTATLSACGMWSQPAAPVEQANPYGGAPQETAPYTPPTASAGVGDQPYAPPPSQGTYTAPYGTYTPSTAPVDLNATTHTVVYGDTVYNLAKRYHISENDLRLWNNLPDNNVRIGQVLTVRGTPTGGTAYTPAPVTTPTTPTPPVAQPTTPAAPSAASGNTREVGGIVWMRPTQGTALSGYGGANKGIEYGGTAGQPIYAAADGKVVYSGSGLRGYGNLVIVQHNTTYLTAYGNNQSLLVKEGQQVRRGQEIARMGNSDASRVQLHFELRENGKPIDPSRFIP